MIIYLRCDEVSDDIIYEAFMAGYSDYMIRLNMEKGAFLQRFFGPEGNARELSYIAMEDKKPLGVVLGGTKELDGVRTMRCGALCVVPKARGTGVAQELMRLHEECARTEECKQLFLEVIAGNDRAISFYRKLGFEKIYDISYYSIERECLERKVSGTPKCVVDVQKADFETIRNLRCSIAGLHLNWQSDVEFFGELNCVHLAANINEKLVGALSFHRGQIFFLWVHPQYRLQGVSRSLLSKMCRACTFENVRISATNNAHMQSYCKYHGMIENKIHQYEMYKWLG